MEFISDFYKPTYVMLPISNIDGMGPREAVYAVKHLLTSAKFIIPMNFNNQEAKNQFDEFVK